MVQKVLIKRTLTPNQPPPALDPGELSVEMASVPPKLWCGVPTTVNGAGMVLLNPPVTDLWVDVAGDTMIGNLFFGPVVGAGQQAVLGVAGDARLINMLTVRGDNGAPTISLTDVNGTVNAALQYNIAAETLDMFVGGGIVFRCGGVGTPYAYMLDQGHVICRAGSATGNCALYLDDAGYATQASFNWEQATATASINSRAFKITAGTPRATCQYSDQAYNYWYNINNRITFDGNLLIVKEGYKAVAGPWAAGSDARAKTVLGDYTQGLAALKQINPVRFQFKGNVTTTAGKSGDPPPEPMHRDVLGNEYIGLLAQDAEGPMPEMVTRASAVIDGTQVDDFRILDITALTYALINSVKELAARVETLEATLSARI